MSLSLFASYSIYESPLSRGIRWLNQEQEAVVFGKSLRQETALWDTGASISLFQTFHCSNFLWSVHYLSPGSNN